MECYLKQLFWNSIFVFSVFANGGIAMKSDTDNSEILPSRASQFGARNEQQSWDGSSLEKFLKMNSSEYHPEKAVTGTPTKQEILSSRNTVVMFHKPSEILEITVLKELFLTCVDKESYEEFCFELNKASSDLNLENIFKWIQTLCPKVAKYSENVNCSFKMYDTKIGNHKTTIENSSINLCALSNFNKEVDYMVDASWTEIDTADFDLKNFKSSFCEYTPLNLKTFDNGHLFKSIDLPFDLPLDYQRGVRFKMFYWTYVSAFLYATYYLTSFLFSQFSIITVIINFLLLQFFPDIIQFSIFNSFDLALSTFYSLM
ncbi:uncharacterized protein [Palaemon carinicauda]